MLNKAIDLIPIPEEHRTTVWRVLISLIVMGHVMWACGWIPGLPGFAKADEVEKRLLNIESKQDLSLRLQLAEEICRIARQQRTTSDRTINETLGRVLQQKQDQYAGVNQGSRYPLNECL